METKQAGQRVIVHSGINQHLLTIPDGGCW
jgi:hypothetical protein